MSQSVVYAAAASSTSGTALGPLTIVRKGRLKGVTLSFGGQQAAAGATAYVSMVLNTNNDIRGINDPDRRATLCRMIVSMPASTFYGANSGFVPLDVPLEIGDVISMQLSLNGGVPTSGYLYATATVQE